MGRPKQRSKVTVILISGVVREYEINAGPTLSQWLAREAGATGILTLLDGDVSYNIPLTQILEYTITEIPANAEGASDANT